MFSQLVHMLGPNSFFTYSFYVDTYVEEENGNDNNNENVLLR